MTKRLPARILVAEVDESVSVMCSSMVKCSGSSDVDSERRDVVRGQLLLLALIISVFVEDADRRSGPGPFVQSNDGLYVESSDGLSVCLGK